MKRLCGILSLVAAAGFALQGFAVGLIVVPDQKGWHPPIIEPPRPPVRPWPPQPLPPLRHAFAPLELTSARVNTRITDQLAVTSVEQEFYNPNPARLEGTFLFPVPKGAQLDKFRMEIDGKMVEAELLAADKARGIYEGIVRSMRDPALLEYAQQDVFKVRIFPIEPNRHKRVAFSYTQLLKSDTGLVRYALPLGAQKYSAASVKSVSVKVELETKRPLKAVYSPSHQVEVRREGDRRATAGFEGSEVPPDADFALYFSTQQDAVGLSLLTHRGSGEDGYFLLLASPGADAKESNVMPKDVAFVLDTSGSMAGKKIEQARKALAFCVNSLGDQDRFEIIRFSTESEPLFSRLAEVSAANRAKAEDFIKGLKAIGGTAIDDALQHALALRPGKSDRLFVIIFLTDGQPTVGEIQPDKIVARVERDARATRIFVFGIGSDVNTHLLDRIAEQSRAFAQYVLPSEDLEVKVSNFFAKIRDPVLANPVVTFSGGIRASKLYPSPLLDLFRGDQLVLVGRFSGSGSAAATIQGTMRDRKEKFVQDVNFDESGGDTAFIARLWATRRVGWLLDEIRLRGESSELKDEVTDLARKYGIVTPYTAYLIVEDEARRGVAINAQTMPQLQADTAARQLTADSFAGFQKSSGDAAVGGAQDRLDLRMATGPSDSSGMNPEMTARFYRRYGIAPAGGGQTPSSAAAPAPAQAATRVVEYAQQQRFVGGRTFFQNGTRWVDSQVQRAAQARRVEIVFGSPEYFEFTRKHPEVTPWLSLGSEIEFLLDGVVYQVRPS